MSNILELCRNDVTAWLINSIIQWDLSSAIFYPVPVPHMHDNSHVSEFEHHASLGFPVVLSENAPVQEGNVNLYINSVL